MADKVLSVRTLFDVEQVDGPDGLGEGNPYVIKINAPFKFKRGLLMMPESDDFFVPATRDGVKTANELCVLADDLGYGEDVQDEGITEYTEAIAYFGGKLAGSKIILAYETEEDNHAELIAELQGVFRRHNFSVL